MLFIRVDRTKLLIFHVISYLTFSLSHMRYCTLLIKLRQVQTVKGKKLAVDGRRYRISTNTILHVTYMLVIISSTM